MTQNLNYLSDEELELLIADVEQNELVMAPPDLLEEILEHIAETEIDIEPDGEALKQSPKPTNNIREFRRYCFRICASVAAAVFLVFAMPAASDNMTTHVPEQKDFAMESKYATKEEALNDESLLMQKLGSINIFDSGREWGIFNGKNGGR